MKNFKILLLIAVSSLIGINSMQATHLMGGELTYNYLDNAGSAGTPFRFELTLNLYIYCSDPGSAFFGNGDQGNIRIGVFNNKTKDLFSTLDLDPNYPLPDARPEAQAGCSVPGVNDNALCIKLNQYVGIIELPASLDGYYIVMERCCRNGTILNLSNPGSQSMPIFTEIPATIFQNSSPNFTASAIPVICAGDTTTIVNNAFDPDGDQLIYGLTQAHGGLYASPGNPGPDPGFGGGGSFNTYNPPLPDLAYVNSAYTVATPFGTGSYAFVNASTGLTKYYATVPGNYVIAVDVYEYRQIGGIDSLIGTTRRDLQFVVATCPANATPSVTVPNPGSIGAPIINDIIYIEQGDSLEFDIQGSDADGDGVEISAQGSIVTGTGGYTGPLATLATTTDTGTVNSTFAWKTDCSLDGNYNFTIDVQDDGCPAKTESNVFTVNVAPFEIADDITGNVYNICYVSPTEAYSIVPNTNSTLQWSAVNGTINGSSTGSAIDVTWDTPGVSQIKVVETSRFGCKDSLIFNMTVKEPDTIFASNDTSYCEGNPLQLSVIGTSSPIWRPNVNISSTSAINPSVSPSTDQWYFVQSSSNCTLEDSVLVSVIDNGSSPLDSMYLCPDVVDSINVTPVTGYSYEWSPTTGITDSSILNAEIQLNNPGTTDLNRYYYLNSIDTNGCTFKDTLKVIVKSKPDVAAINGAFSVCPLSEGMLYWLDSDDYFSYDWSVEGGTIDVSLRENLSVDWGQVSGVAQVGLQVIDYFGCKSDTAKFPVTINSNVQSETPMGATPLCITNASNIPYNVTAYGGNATYTWFYSLNDVIYSGGSQAFPSNSNISVMNWDSVGTMKLWVKVNYPTNDTVACLVESDTLDVLIESQPAANLNISTAPDTICEGSGTDVIYSVSGLPNSSYAWTVTGGTITGGNGSGNITVDWSNFGTNTLTVLETSQYGCLGTLQLSTIEYFQNPTPTFEGPSTVCEGFLLNVDHTVTGWPNSNFLWTVNGYNVTHENGTEDGIGTIDWTGLEEGESPTILITEFAENGCFATIDRQITFSSESAKIEYVTTNIDDPEVIDLQFNINAKNDQNLTLYRRVYDSFKPWDIVSNLTTTDIDYTDATVNTSQEAYDYRIGFDNECVQEYSSGVHTSILLEAINNGNASALIWNQYLAWDSGVATYEVWRSVDGGAWELYDNANNDSKSIDFDNGDDGLAMCYRIAAVKNDSIDVESWSNEVCLDFPHPIMIYNAFSPNGDTRNEYFFVENLTYYNVESIEIVNRWGNQVYQDTNYDNLWNGGDLPDGTYFYVIKFTEFEEPFKGTVLIHR